MYNAIPIPATWLPCPVKTYAVGGCSTTASPTNTASPVAALTALTSNTIRPLAIAVCAKLTLSASPGSTMPTNLALHAWNLPASASAASCWTTARTTALVCMPWVMVPGRFAYAAKAGATWMGLLSRERRA